MQLDQTETSASRIVKRFLPWQLQAASSAAASLTLATGRLRRNIHSWAVESVAFSSKYWVTTRQTVSVNHYSCSRSAGTIFWWVGHAPTLSSPSSTFPSPSPSLSHLPFPSLSLPSRSHGFQTFCRSAEDWFGVPYMRTVYYLWMMHRVMTDVTQRTVNNK